MSKTVLVLAIVVTAVLVFGITSSIQPTIQVADAEKTPEKKILKDLKKISKQFDKLNRALDKAIANIESPPPSDPAITAKLTEISTKFTQENQKIAQLFSKLSSGGGGGE